MGEILSASGLVSVVLCSRDRAVDLEAALTRLAGLDQPATGLELVVVDNGSTDATAEVVQRAALTSPYPVRYVHERVPGLSRARNAGVAAAAGDLLLFTDDDVRVPPHWAVTMADALAKAEAAVGAVVLPAHLRREWLTPRLLASVAACTEALDPAFPQTLMGANMGLRRESLAAAGGFDEALGAGTQVGGGEETLLALRLRDAGARVVLVTGAEAEHHMDAARFARPALLAHAARCGRSDAEVLRRWRPGTRSTSRAVLAARARLLAAQWRGFSRRLPEGIAEAEFLLVSRLAYVRTLRAAGTP